MSLQGVVDATAMALGGAREMYGPAATATGLPSTSGLQSLKTSLGVAVDSPSQAWRGAGGGGYRLSGGKGVAALDAVVGADGQVAPQVVAASDDSRESERLAAVRDQVRREAGKRRADHRADAGSAIARMQRRGETLTTIAELTGVGVGEVRAMLRHAPKVEKPTAAGGSHARGGGLGSAAAAHSGGNGVVTDATTV